ncbi:hypothetical protein FRC20_003552 [Serendipita sp. 405]|nr:hypothetical protein FRC16_004312 [Serendipita sp. 398]KAG8844377.1 hypothetical protein FRC20_003552 [Serendipita sp. 405]
MKGFSDLSKSLGRAASVRQDKRPTVVTDANGEGAKDESQLTPKADRTPTAARSADDLFAFIDTLARAPSQDISRPFDSVPDPTAKRASEARSFSRASKKSTKRSTVANRAPTVGNTLDGTLTPFGDAFKAFVQEPVPSRTNGPSSPSPSAIPSLVSNTTLDDPDETRTAGSVFLAPPSTTGTAPAAAIGATGTNTASAPAKVRTSDDVTRGSQSPTPSKDGVFRGFLRVFGMKNRAVNSMQPEASEKKTTSLAVNSTPNKRHSIAAINPPTKAGNEAQEKENNVSDSMNGYKEKNSSQSSLGRGFGPFRKLGRLSTSKDAKEDISSPKSPRFPPVAGVKTAAEKPKEESSAQKVEDEDAPLQPPVPLSTVTSDARASPRYTTSSLQPIEEDEKQGETKSD